MSTSSLKLAPTGARTPRVSRFPDYPTSAGREAVRLAADAGLQLDPWQQDLLVHSLGEDRSGMWSAFEVGVMVSRQNGKGALLEARALAGLLLFGERLIVHTAHEMKTSLEAFRRIQVLFQATPDLRRRVKRVINQRGEEGIELRDGARLRFIARSKGSGRGFSGDLVILDEAYALTADQMDALMPTMSARDNPQIWYTSSPPLNVHSGEQLFSVRRRGEGDGDRLAWFDWGVKGCLDNLDAIDLDDRRLWAQANPAYGIRISEWFVERERQALTREGFARERLGVWPPDLGQGFTVIPAEAWTAAEDPASRVAGRMVLAPSVSLDRSRTTITVAGWRADGKAHVEVIEAGPGTGWVPPSLTRLAGTHRPVATVVDEFGPTGSLIPDIEAAGVTVQRMTTSDVARAFGMFYDAVCGDDAARILRHLGQPELTEAVAGGMRRSLGDGTAWDRKKPTTDITPVVSATNALWGLLMFGRQESTPAVPMVTWR